MSPPKAVEPPGSTVDTELRRLLVDLVSIDSANPDLVPGSAGEGEAARYVGRWLQQRGFEVEVLDSGAPGRPNVVGVLRGTGGGRTLMLNGHLDTVGAAGVKDPHRARIENGRLYGRGALDMKGGLSALLYGAARATTHRPRGDVVVTAVVDEEFHSIGTESVLRRWGADGAIVAEPTNLEIVTCHKGFVWLEVTVDGVAAHGSRPDEGIDAIAKAGRLLVGIDELAAQLARGPAHPMLGPGSVHASLITGGQELSSYPASCQVHIERRIVPGEGAGTVLAEMRRIVDDATSCDSSFKATTRIAFERSPLTENRDSAIVSALAEAYRAVIRWDPVFTGHSGWMDAALLADAGIPTVVFGPTGEGLHAAEEWVDLTSVQKCSDVVLATINIFCGNQQ